MHVMEKGVLMVQTQRRDVACSAANGTHVSSPATEVTDGCEPLCGCQELNLGPTEEPEEPPVLLTTGSP